MSCFSEFSQFSVSITNQEDLDAVEMSRRKALERINALYNEILSPADTVMSDAEISSLSDREDNTESEKVQNHFLKSCCTTLRELCSKCQQRISQCKSCNYCSCSNTSSVKCRKKSRDDSESSSRGSSSRHTSQSAVKCTKPCPFSFVAKDNERLRAKEEKLAKIKETLNQQIDSELKVRVVSKPVPKHVYLPLYKQMAEAKEKRKTVRKGTCSNSLNNAKRSQVDDNRLLREGSESVISATTSHDFVAKPTQESRRTSTKDECFKVPNNAKSLRVVDSYKFRERSKSSSDFSASKPQGLTTQTIPKNIHSNRMVEKLPSSEHANYAEISKSSSDLNALKSPSFKAKPAPKNILSNKISEKLKNKEQVRKMLMTERAHQLKEQSSLPFSQRNLPRASSMINLDNFAKPNKEYSKKNISEITKRLYVVKCNNALNAWNEKVLKVVTGKKFEDTVSGRNEKRLERKSLPFLFFPVRMSNAALLREKEIR